MNHEALKSQIIKEITGDKAVHMDLDLASKIEKMIQEVERLSTFNPISRAQTCQYNEMGAKVKVAQMPIESQSLCRFLEGAPECILMAATLGARIEQRLSVLQLTDMAGAYLFDCVCLYYLEAKLDEWEENLREILRMENKYLSKRFSPGYGDLSLEIQKNLLAYLDAHRRIGIELTENYLMIPQKSVTAILGVHTRPFKDKYARCDACIRRENCKRQGGGHCEFHS